MPDISMQREHDLGTDEVRGSLEKLAGKLADRLGGSWHWEGDTIVCDSRGATARVGYDERSITIEVTLPRAFKLMRGRLEERIEQSFDRYFRDL